jgi:predicted lysophospholipase L1 biosynthesis ABC-type transport system permease subunit
MNNKLIWLLLFLVVLVVSIVLYINMGEETRANVIFFGSLILACLVGGLLVVSGIKYFFKSL